MTKSLLKFSIRLSRLSCETILVNCASFAPAIRWSHSHHRCRAPLNTAFRISGLRLDAEHTAGDTFFLKTADLPAHFFQHGCGESAAIDLRRVSMVRPIRMDFLRQHSPRNKDGLGEVGEIPFTPNARPDASIIE